MVRVFNYNEIASLPALSEGHEQFPQEVKRVRTALWGLHHGGDVSGALIYGSAAFGDAELGSDIDLLVVADHTTPDMVSTLHGVASDIYDRSRIMLDLSLFRPDDLLEGRHHYRPNMVLDLVAQARDFPENVIGDSPLEIMKPLTTEIIKDIDEYFDFQRSALEKRYMLGFGPNPEQLLEMALNSPHRTGRKALCALQFLGKVPADTLPDMKKQTIAASVKAVFGEEDPRLIRLYEALTFDLCSYKMLCRGIVDGSVQQAEYDHGLRSFVRQDVSQALELIDRTQQAYRRHVALSVPLATMVEVE